ncbi:hypothetical protein C2845_PM06G26170 [Panicum miliaceum]|uniref:Uncharacterized protein n=1 Tax=Panicum miliaceum TaxID=4540 RepID=A0A3L6RC57_PANMI|nr:hypothetical protein C2845_PM06G26170 [Panicum miliaceum]
METPSGTKRSTLVPGGVPKARFAHIYIGKIPPLLRTITVLCIAAAYQRHPAPEPSPPPTRATPQPSRSPLPQARTICTAAATPHTITTAAISRCHISQHRRQPRATATTSCMTVAAIAAPPTSSTAARARHRQHHSHAALTPPGRQTFFPTSTPTDSEAQLEAEKMQNAELRSIVINQSKQLEEAEQTRIRDKQEMSKKYADLEVKIDQAN